MEKVIHIAGTAYLLITQKSVSPKEAYRTSKEYLNAAKLSEKLDPTEGNFNIIKTYIDILRGCQ